MAKPKPRFNPDNYVRSVDRAKPLQRVRNRAYYPPNHIREEVRRPVKYDDSGDVATAIAVGLGLSLLSSSSDDSSRSSNSSSDVFSGGGGSFGGGGASGSWDSDSSSSSSSDSGNSSIDS